MNPIAAALEGFDLTYILAAGGAVIVFVVAYVGIDKVKELVSGEEKEDGYTYYFNPETGAITGVRGSDGVYQDYEEAKTIVDEERYDHYVMSKFVDSENLSESENERWGAYYDKYGSANEFSEADQARYTERFRSEFAFDDDD